ncbi:hypothetical protein CYY_004621 [Polysphondylium violaceum]|uniref:Rho-GAP domain-containing protein n=1 Tax=Polysphondylium violaceum TaxID=133409 RepID=A0A8J4PW83_9MYCE|nr:hypothetical protein CYY_004621 [Polysphondylium violaceum]
MKFGKKKDKDQQESSDKKDTSSNGSNLISPRKGKVFGNALPLFDDNIPDIIIQTTEYLEHFGLDTPGIFRESGSLQQIQNYKSLYDQEKPVNFTPYEPHVVASLLKCYLRELRDPLLTFEHYDMFIACESINDEKVKVEVIKKVLKCLPAPNIRVMKFICNFLLKVVAHSEQNKMTPDTLSIVFLPTILRPKAETDQEILQYTVEDSKSTKTLMSSILLNYDEIFEDPSLLAPKSRQTRAQTEFVSPSSSASSNTSHFLKQPISASAQPQQTHQQHLISPSSSPSPSPIGTAYSSPSFMNSNASNYSSSEGIANESPYTSPKQQPIQTTTTTTTANTLPPIPLDLSLVGGDSSSNPSGPLTPCSTTTLPPTTPTSASTILTPRTPNQDISIPRLTTLPPLPPLPTLPPPPPDTTVRALVSPRSLPQLPQLPSKPPTLVPPKPIPKIPNMMDTETRQRSNTTVV